MTLTFSPSHHRLRLVKPRRLFRHLTADAVPPPPPQTNNDDSIISEAVQLLQNPNPTPQLVHLLFPHSSPPPPPRLLLRIARRLPSSSHALRFLHFLRSDPVTLDHPISLSSTFQAVFELAARERDSGTKLLELYRKSREENIGLTVDSATLLIRHFGRIGQVEDSIRLFDEIDYLRGNVHVRNVMVDVLVSAGRMGDALKVFEEMPERSDGSGSQPDGGIGDIVFSCLWKGVHSGRGMREEEIVDWVLKFGGRGVFPNPVQVTQFITRMCRSGKSDVAWQFLCELMKLGTSVGVAPCNALLTGLGRDRKFEKMNKLMGKMKEMNIRPNVVTFGILINHMCKFRRVNEALELFEKMGGGEGSEEVSVEPDVIIYNTLIDGLCKVGRQEEGLSLMGKMRLQKGCGPNTVTYNCLIDGFCKAGEIERGVELFEAMKKEGVVPNVITLNTLIDGMCRCGRINRAVELFGEIRKEGLKADAVTYTTLINAFCSVNNIDKAMELFEQMWIDGCFPDAIVYYTLISGLSQAGRMNDASSVFSKLKEAGFLPDVVCYNVLINGFCKTMKMDKAIATVKEMKEVGIKPDSITYNTLISYLSKTGKFKIAHRLLREMIKEKLAPTVFTYGALIHACCLDGNVDKAMSIFKKMDTSSSVLPNTVIYNILIDALCKNDDLEGALFLMDDMKLKRVSPNTNTFNTLFKGLREKKWLKKAIELVDSMVEQDCSPDYITMEILTEWFSAVGETEKLKKFVRGNDVSALTA